MYRKNFSLCLLATALMMLWLAACQPGMEKSPEVLASQQVPSDMGSPSGAPQTTSVPTDTAAAIQTLWETSPHADTYVADAQGNNSTCARCHTPVNFVPTMGDMPESCATCKFEVDPPPPVIEKAEWENIQCNVCHRVKKGVVDSKFSWLSIPPIDEYEDLISTTDLCLKCHLQVDVPGHGAVDLVNAHAGYTCTQCHDAHSTTASCTSGDCHVDLMDPSLPIPGHDENHKKVACVACHDAGGMKIGPDEQGYWITLLPDSPTPFASHNIVKEALCERCHYLNNPWNLSADVSKGTP